MFRTAGVPDPGVFGIARISGVVPAAPTLEDQHFKACFRKPAPGNRSAKAAANYDHVEVHVVFLLGLVTGPSFSKRNSRMQPRLLCRWRQKSEKAAADPVSSCSRLLTPPIRFVPPRSTTGCRFDSLSHERRTTASLRPEPEPTRPC